MNLIKQYIIIFCAVLMTACSSGGGDSAPTPGVVASTSSITIAENTSTTFDVVLRTEPVDNVVINVSSSDLGEATMSVSSLTFTSSSGGGDLWNVPQTVTISGAQDGVADGNQNINIVLDPATSTDSEYSALSPSAVAATISDIDSAGFTVVGSSLSTTENGTAASFTVAVNTIPTGNVIVDVLSADVSEGTVSVSQLNFDSTNWQTPQTVTVSPAIDSIVDGNQTYNVTMNINGNTTDTSGYADLTLAPVSVTNADNDAVGVTVSTASLGTTENGSVVTYTVVLNTMPDDVVDIDVASADTSEGAVSPALLSFDGSNWDAPQTVTVSPIDDLIADGNKTYNVTMGVNLTNTVDTSGYADLTFIPVIVTNADDDTAGVTISTATLNTIENGPTTSYTIVLNTEPFGPVVIDIASTNTNEGTVSVSQIGFNETNWQTPRTITVTPVDDAVDDGNQIYDITNSINTGSTYDITGYDLLTLPSVSVTNADDDTAGFTVTPLTLNTTEGGVDVTYTVVLNTAPAALKAVWISLASTNTSEGVVSVGGVNFNDTNWSTPRVVTVSPVNDILVDGDIVYNVTNSIGSLTDDPNYIDLPAINIAVTNADNDYPDEGAFGASIVLPLVNLPHSGTVGAGSSSYYEITGLTAGTPYTVSISEVTADADLFVYDASNYTTVVCSSASVGDDSCAATPTGTSLWVRVGGQYTGNRGAAFTLDVQPPVEDFASSNTPLALVDAGTVTDTIAANLATNSLTEVSVLVNLTHTWDSDLIITLISPTGTRVILANQNGADGDNFESTIFIDSSLWSLAAGAPPYAGEHSSNEPLSILNGEDGNGTWTLEIQDIAMFDTGDLLNWALTLK